MRAKLRGCNSACTCRTPFAFVLVVMVRVALPRLVLYSPASTAIMADIHAIKAATVQSCFIMLLPITHRRAKISREQARRQCINLVFMVARASRLRLFDHETTASEALPPPPYFCSALQNDTLPAREVACIRGEITRRINP